MKINIGTNRGNIIGVKINKEWGEISFKDIRQIVDQKFEDQHVHIYGWAPFTEKQNPELYKERDWYKNLSKKDQESFDQKFSEVISEGLEGEVLFYVEIELKKGALPMEALLSGMEDWDIL